MNEEMLLIFGAGASYDCVDINKTTFNDDFRPPLTNQLFERGYDISGRNKIASAQINLFKDRLLENHHFASSIGYEFDSNENFETYLLKLKESTFEIDRKRYFALFYYLKELFSEISSNFLRAKLDNNYVSLLNNLIRTNYLRFNILTTNYDTILDETIEKFNGVRFDSLGKYLNFSGNNKCFNYLKLHGSSDWSYSLNGYWSKLNNKSSIIKGTVSFDDRSINFLKDSPHIVVDKMRNTGQGFPALAVPLGKYNYIYQNQIDNFKSQNLNIKSILVVGFAGKDNTVFELLNEIIKEKIHLFIVDSGEQEVVRVADTFRKSLNDKIFNLKEEVNYYPNGFTGFVQDDLDRWSSYVNSINNSQ